MTPEHSALINHLMQPSNCCHGQSGRYCPVGRELWLEHQAEGLISLETRTERNYALGNLRVNAPQYADEIERRARARFEVRK